MIKGTPIIAGIPCLVCLPFTPQKSYPASPQSALYSCCHLVLKEAMGFHTNPIYDFSANPVRLVLYPPYDSHIHQLQQLTSVMCSSHTAPSIISTFLYLHNVEMISLTSFLNLPYSTFFLYFGMKTIWYWHFQRTCYKLLLSIWIASFVLRLACDTFLVVT